MGRISTSFRYLIDTFGMNLLAFGGVGGISSSLASFGNSGCPRMMKIGRCVRDLQKLT